MKIIGIKYGILISTLIFLFANFIACGSQFYKVSVANDTDNKSKTVSSSMANPKSLQYGIHAMSGWQKLPIEFKIGSDFTTEQIKGLKAAMKTWEIAIGKPLFKYIGIDKGVTGDSFQDLYGSLADKINGHYMDGNWAKTGKPPIVLATTIWNGNKIMLDYDMRFNKENYNFGNSLKMSDDDELEHPGVDIESLSLHELGHALGLAHVSEDVDPYSIMKPALFIGAGLTSRILSEGDVKRIQRIYGCYKGEKVDACNIDEVLAYLQYEKDDDNSGE